MDLGDPNHFLYFRERHSPDFQGSNSSEGIPQASHFLAQLLGGESSNLPSLLHRGQASSFEEAIRGQSDAERAQLKTRAGTGLSHWIALSKESHPEFFYRKLLALGKKAEAKGSLELAGRIYGALGSRKDVPPKLKSQARESLTALNGGGSFGQKFESFLDHAVDGLWDPAMILGMSVGGTAFRLGRYFALSGFTQARRVGLGYEALATLAGIGTESLAFTAATQSIHGLFGPKVGTLPLTFTEEWAGTGLLLGSLRAMGSFTGVLAKLLSHSRPLSQPGLIAAQQFGMYQGIVLGHGLQNYFNLGGVPSEDLLAQSIFTLIHFNAGAYVAHRTLGRNFKKLENDLDKKIQGLRSARPNLSRPLLDRLGQALFPQVSPPWAAVGPQLLMMEANGNGSPSSRPGPLRISRPPMGLRNGKLRGPVEPFLPPEEAVARLRELLPEGRLTLDRLEDPALVSQILECFNITSHAYDQAAFARAFRLAQERPELVERLAFDVDEVLLHWSWSPWKAFRGWRRIFSPNRQPEFHRTPEKILDYKPFALDPSIPRPLWQRGLSLIQKVLPTSFRFNAQFHPGMRAYLLGLRMGQRKNIIMDTTGPAGKVLLLINEDPAFRMIFTGKLPDQSLSMDQLRSLPNVFTREDKVLAMRQVLQGDSDFSLNPLVREYLIRVQQNPSGGHKLKDPAIPIVLGKRRYNILVDDSSTAFDMLHNANDFTVLQPPSARPWLTSNFVIGSTQRYLDGMSNASVQRLAEILEGGPRNKSQKVKLAEDHQVPQDYPHQRFVLDIPWRRYLPEFFQLGHELKVLASRIGKIEIADPENRNWTESSLKLSESQEQKLVERFQREIAVLLEGSSARASVHSERVENLQAMARESWAQFQDFADRHLTSREQENLNIGETPWTDGVRKKYSRVAGVIATKRAALELLGLNPDHYSLEVEFRYGRAKVRGEAKSRLGSRVLLTTQSNDGDLGVGVAVLTSEGSKGILAGIGIDMTTARSKHLLNRLKVTPEGHALAEAAYKATYAHQPVRRFNRHRYPEIEDAMDFSGGHRHLAEVQDLRNGSYLLTGKTAGAARKLNGEEFSEGHLLVRGRVFHTGNGVFALVAIPTPRVREGSDLFAKPDPRPEPSPPLGFPYLKTDDGRFVFPESRQSVVVLGDVAGTRTFELASQGHRPIHIDRDAEYFNMSMRAVDRREEIARTKGKLNREISTTWEAGDWYHTKAQADYVEAYFPWNLADVPPEWSPQRTPMLKEFLDKALNTKLGPKGKGAFVISEVNTGIDDLAKLIEADPKLELLEVRHVDRWDVPVPLPIVGGHGMTRNGDSGFSWLVYRPRGEGAAPGTVRWDDLSSKPAPEGKVAREPAALEPAKASWVPADQGAIFPYRELDTGHYLPRQAQQTVTVLGDVSGARTFELASQGHRVHHVDKDGIGMGSARRRMRVFSRDKGLSETDLSIEWIQGDWFQTTTTAKFVEAYAPLTPHDISIHKGSLSRQQFLRLFMDKALHSKLAPDWQGVSVVSRHPDLVQDLETLVHQDPKLQVLQAEYNRSRQESTRPLPLEGGYQGVFEKYADHDFSWIVYGPRGGPSGTRNFSGGSRGKTPPTEPASGAEAYRSQFTDAAGRNPFYREAPANFPYLITKGGEFELPPEPLDVVVLGDVYGPRTAELGMKGHRVLHIDNNPNYLNQARERVEGTFHRARLEQGYRPPPAEFLEGDWYHTRAQADLVEAYFPFGGILKYPVPSELPARMVYFYEFLERAVHSKLGPNPKGVFITTEVSRYAEEVAEVIRREPGLELLQVEIDRPQPLLGGLGLSFRESSTPVSWVVYRPLPKPGK